jgi:hypothetical protein
MTGSAILRIERTSGGEVERAGWQLQRSFGAKRADESLV